MFTETDLLKLKENNDNYLNLLREINLQKEEVICSSPTTQYKSKHSISIATNLKEYLYSICLRRCLEYVKDTVIDEICDEDEKDELALQEQLNDLLDSTMNNMDQKICLGTITKCVNDFIRNCNSFDKYDDDFIRENISENYDLIIDGKSFKKAFTNNTEEFITKLWEECNHVYKYLQEKDELFEDEYWSTMENFLSSVENCYNFITNHDLDESAIGSMYDDDIIEFYKELLYDTALVYRLDSNTNREFKETGNLNIDLIDDDVQNLKDNVISICINYYELLYTVIDNIEDYRKDRKTNYLSLYVMSTAVETYIKFNYTEFLNDLDKRFRSMYYLLGLEKCLVDEMVIDYKDIRHCHPIAEHILKALIREDLYNPEPIYLVDYTYFPNYIDDVFTSLLEMLGPDYIEMLINVMNKNLKKLSKCEVLVDILMHCPAMRKEQYELAYENHEEILDILVNKLDKLINKRDYKKELQNTDFPSQVIILGTSKEIMWDLATAYDYLYIILKIASCISYEEYINYNNKLAGILIKYVDIFVDYPNLEIEIIKNDYLRPKYSACAYYSDGPLVIDNFCYEDDEVKDALIRQILEYAKSDYNLAKSVVKYMIDVSRSIIEGPESAQINFTPFILLNGYDGYIEENTVRELFIEDEFFTKILMEVELNL